MKGKALIGWMCLFGGGIIYIFFRSHTLLYEVFHHFAPYSFPAPMTGLGEFLVYSLPGGLWSLGYVLVMDSALKAVSLRLRLIMTGIMPFVGLLSELLQYLLPGFSCGRAQLGTFDPADLLAYFLPYAVYVIIIVFNSKIQ